MRSYKYKGLIIYKNNSSRFKNSSYYSIVNPKLKDKNGRMLHAHGMSESQMRKIADCFRKIMHRKYPNKYSLNVRSKASRLLGFYIKMK